MVGQGSAIYDPPRQTRSVILCWMTVDKWAETLYDWVGGLLPWLLLGADIPRQVNSTGQLSTILTHYEIQNPAVSSSPMADIPLPLLLRAIQVLVKSGRAQQIEGSEDGGVRFFRGAGK